MKSVLSLVLGILIALISYSDCLSQNGTITIAGFTGYPGNGAFLVPDNPFIALRFTNNTGAPIHSLSTGFKISSLPAGGELRGPVDLSPYFYSGSSHFGDFFDLETEVFAGSNTGDVDTIGFYGRADSTNPLMGMPVGFDSNAIWVSLGLTTHSTSKVCIDTCSLPPNRPWRWTNTSVTPEVIFTPEFVGMPGQVYQNGEGPDRIGSGYCWNTIGTWQPPVISNCPPGTSIIGSPCTQFVFDFDAQDPEGDPITGFGLVSGPGTINLLTGLWSWPDVSNADTGSHQVEVYASDIGGRGPSTVLYITVNPSPAVAITSGCNTDIMVTGESREIQMGTSNGACDDNVWSMTQIYGSPSGANCTLNGTGLISFVATDPGLYEYRVTVTDSLVRDSCNHFFVVHGGPGCCVAERGNVDGTGGVDLSDLSRMVAYMYNASTVLPCWDEANISGSGIIDLTDLSILISYLTVPGSVTLANCP